ncbi:MAG: low-specificity L-threonine aldolase [Chloroflexi bacterium]|nr:low-specificity L-threonine aldolase [Chloroflexota bacterium]
MQAIDLRSDTVTHPTPEMRQAMAEAAVGDDVWGDDPSVQRLERLAAEMLGKEAALFVVSGTMGNTTCLLTHCGRGDEIIVGKVAHTFKYEVGASAALGSIHSYPIPVQPDGTLDLHDIEHAIRDSSDVHYPVTKLVALENTQGSIGGIPISAEYTQALRDLCDRHGLKLHLDGARLFNAAAALEVDVKTLVAPVDSVSFCLSKGLCAPIGSIIAGSAEFIGRARRTRKMLGGGWRQAGIIAAAGIIALETMPKRLHEDHANAKALASALSQLEGLHIDMGQVQTNMIFIQLDQALPFTAYDLEAQLAEQNILMDVWDERFIRLVTHYWITPERVQTVIDAVRACFSQPVRS